MQKQRKIGPNRAKSGIKAGGAQVRITPAFCAGPEVPWPRRPGRGGATSVWPAKRAWIFWTRSAVQA